MKYDDVLVAFINNEPCECKFADDVKTDGDKLFFNNTCVAQWNDEDCLINYSTYFNQTKICSKLLRILTMNETNIKFLHNVPIGAEKLLDYDENWV